MTLDEGKRGGMYMVTGLSLPEATKHRLEAIGMTVGTKVSILERKGNGRLIVKVRGARFAMGSGITRNISSIPAPVSGFDLGL